MSVLPHQEFAPIALFVYARPDHVKRTVAGLLQNQEASSHDLYIFCDAPKQDKHAEGVALTRAYVETIEGFRSVHITYRKHNLGLAQSIIDGVSLLCHRFCRVIVMEDD